MAGWRVRKEMERTDVSSCPLKPPPVRPLPPARITKSFLISLMGSANAEREVNARERILLAALDSVEGVLASGSSWLCYRHFPRTSSLILLSDGEAPARQMSGDFGKAVTLPRLRPRERPYTLGSASSVPFSSARTTAPVLSSRHLLPTVAHQLLAPSSLETPYRRYRSPTTPIIATFALPRQVLPYLARSTLRPGIFYLHLLCSAAASGNKIGRERKGPNKYTRIFEGGASGRKTGASVSS